MKKKLCLASAVALACSSTLAQQFTGPKPFGGIHTGALRTQIMSWKPWNSQLQVRPASFFSPTGGNAYLGSFEAPDDYDAVQLVFANAGTSAWGVKQATVAPSSSYGASSFDTSGVSPFDQNGNSILTTLPVTFNGAGAYAQPWPPAMSSFDGNPFKLNTAVLPLLLSNATAAGSATLNFASTTPNGVYGGTTPSVGYYVSDGLQCIPAGTKIASVTGTTITLTTNVQSPGCSASQQIWITPAQPTLNATVPATTNPPARSLTYSDWVPVSSLARIDGTPSIGMTASGTGIALGSLVTSAGPASIGLSPATTGSISRGSAITFSLTKTASAAIAAGARVYLDTSGLRRGQKLAHSAFPSSANITNVGDGFVDVDALVTSTIASGDFITVSQVSYAQSNVATGQTLIPVISTSNKPLLLVRLFATNGSAPWAYSMAPSASVAEQALKLPDYARFYTGGRSAGTAFDGLNFPNLLTNNAGQVSQSAYSPIYAINFHTRHRGVVVLMLGDSHYEGFQTASFEANFVRLAAAQLSTPETPISVINEAYSGYNLNTFGPSAALWMNTTKPGVVVLQASSPNGGDTVQSYLTDIGRLADLTQSYGGRPIFGTDMPRTARIGMTFRTVNAITNGTSLILDSYYSGTVLPGTGFLVSGPDVPAGLTATTNNIPGNTITLASPATIPAGSLLTFGQIPTSGVTSNSTSVTLANPLPTAWSVNVSIPGCSATAFVSPTFNSASQTLNASCSIPSGTVVTMTGPQPAGYAKETAQVRGLVLGLAGGSNYVFDAFGPVEDPTDPGNWLPGYSADTIHGFDKAQAVLASSFLPTLAQVVGR